MRIIFAIVSLFLMLQFCYADDLRGDIDNKLAVTVIPPGICGNVNGDTGVNVGDVIYIINYIFRPDECFVNPPIGYSPEPYELGDVNCDGSVNIADAVYLGNVIFRPGSPEPCAACP